MTKKAVFLLIIVLTKLNATAQQNYLLDIKNSKILWKLETMGRHYGDIGFKSGNLIYSANRSPKGGSFIIDMHTMRSLDGNAAGLKKVDGMLRSPDFFDVGEFPVSHIVVTAISPAGNKEVYRVVANLTIKGISNTIIFNAQLKPTEKKISGSAKLLLDRRKWQIHYKPEGTNIFGSLKDMLMTGDIQIELDLWFVPAN